MNIHFNTKQSHVQFIYQLLLSMIQVMQRNFLRSGKILGTFKLDVATVMSQQGILQFMFTVCQYKGIIQISFQYNNFIFLPNALPMHRFFIYYFQTCKPFVINIRVKHELVFYVFYGYFKMCMQQIINCSLPWAQKNNA